MNAITAAAQDSATMLGREIKHSLRLIRLLIVSAILVPVVMLLLFDYILGGTIGQGLGAAARGAPYVDFLVPGILLMVLAGGCGPTAINVNVDMTGGFMDRIRTMAVTRGALVAGHVAGSVLRTLVATAAVTGVALLVGFRPKASVADWLAVIGIVAAFSFALAWLSAAIGMVTKSVAGANGSTLPLSFLLPFLSSTFVPTATMPVGVRWFATNQPFTPVVDSLRALLTGAPVGNGPWPATCGPRSLSGVEPGDETSAGDHHRPARRLRRLDRQGRSSLPQARPAGRAAARLVGLPQVQRPTCHRPGQDQDPGRGRGASCAHQGAARRQPRPVRGGDSRDRPQAAGT
jgi:ABC-2 type transport system permease protein